MGDEISNRKLLSPKASYVQHTPAQKNPQNNVRFSVINISKNQENDALAYRKNYLSTKGEATKIKYLGFFDEFLQYNGKSPYELIVQRHQDLLNPDLKIQRTIETQFLNFITQKSKEG